MPPCIISRNEVRDRDFLTDCRAFGELDAAGGGEFVASFFATVLPSFLWNSLCSRSLGLPVDGIAHQRDSGVLQVNAVCLSRFPITATIKELLISLVWATVVCEVRLRLPASSTTISEAWADYHV